MHVSILRWASPVGLLPARGRVPDREEGATGKGEQGQGGKGGEEDGGRFLTAPAPRMCWLPAEPRLLPAPCRVPGSPRCH